MGPRRILKPRYFTPWGEAATTLPDGREVLVWQGIPGEEAEVEKLGEGRSQVRARWIRSRRPDRRRQEPPCKRYSLCGGCPLMHIEPRAQQDARLAIARAAFQEQGLAELVPREVVPSPDGDLAYRHLVKLAVGRSEQGRVRLGAFARGTHDVVPVPECDVSTPTLRELMTVVAHHCIELGIEPFEPETGRGSLRYVVMRQSRMSGQVLVTLVAGHGGREPRALADRVQEGHGQVAGIALHINSQPGNAIFHSTPGEAPGFTRLTGTPLIEEDLAGVRLRIGPGDFFQANPGTADRIARDLTELLHEDRERPVVDLYCGVGGFTLALGRAHGWAFGAELTPGAVDRARENAALNKIPAEFAAGRVLDVLPEVARRTEGRAPVVLVDPARRGLEEGVIDGILGLQPARIAYISCNPRALGRDLRLLGDRGWTPRRVRAYDMFPQTAHLEMLVILDPAEPPEVLKRAPRRRIIRKE